MTTLPTGIAELSCNTLDGAPDEVVEYVCSCLPDGAIVLTVMYHPGGLGCIEVDWARMPDSEIFTSYL